MTADSRRRLPSVDRLLQDPQVCALLECAPRSDVVAAARAALAAARTRRAGPPDDWAAEIAERMRHERAPSLRPVLNATGVVLHTNLGRAPLARAAIDALTAVAAGYSALEFDLPSGRRGSRSDHARTRLAALTGAADALVVNNAASALVLALDALAAGREVAISRGELIEIGGSFRIPEIMEKSGARLREIGTTNRTRADDYRSAIASGASAVLIVHRSNFEQRGFVATPEPAEIAAIARAAGIPCIHDLGSGLLADLSAWGLTGEPDIRSAVAAGSDVVIFSGDKLLGGPQAGCIVGTSDAVARCRNSPFARAVRADKLTLAALEATLRLYDDPADARAQIPVLAMLTADPARLAERAEALARLCPAEARAALVGGASAVGGGAFPGASLPTTLVALDPASLTADALALRLRTGVIPVVARVSAGRVVLDPRTLPDSAFGDVAAAIREALDLGFEA